MYIDPNSKDVYARDAANILVVKYITDEQAMQQYPEFGDIILDSDSAIDNDEDYPETNLAATEGQIFNTDETTTYHNKRKYIERYTKEMHTYIMFRKIFKKRIIIKREKYKEYLINQYVKLSKITGKVIVLMKLLWMNFFWFYKVSVKYFILHTEPEFDEMGNMIQEPQGCWT